MSKATRTVKKVSVNRSRRRAVSAISGIERRRDGQALAIHSVIRHFGGLLLLARRTSKLLDDRDFSIQTWNNWRARGGVPLSVVFKIARDLKIDPRVLNFKGASATMSDEKSWREVIESVKFLDDRTKRQILSYKAPTL
jgi:hypothetical protein